MISKMKIALGGDHAGYAYKKAIIELLESKGIRIRDFGPFSSESCDYPDFVHPVAQAIANGECTLGIIICGSGNGVAMTVNKHQNIRCALAWEPELVELSRSHNDANVISIPARYVSLEVAKEIVSVFLNTEFEGGRHQKRVLKIPCVQ